MARLAEDHAREIQAPRHERQELADLSRDPEPGHLLAGQPVYTHYEELERSYNITVGKEGLRALAVIPIHHGLRNEYAGNYPGQYIPSLILTGL